MAPVPWMRQYMKGIPDELLDAAKIDGPHLMLRGGDAHGSIEKIATLPGLN